MLTNNLYRYYIRIDTKHITEFEKYLTESGMEFSQVANNISTLTYSVYCSEEDEICIRLRFNLVGCFQFNRVLDKYRTSPK